jgi:hypothetical protein
MKQAMKNTGGTAFPTAAAAGPIGAHEGLTKRDYFAAKILQGWCSLYGLPTRTSQEQSETEAYDRVAERCYAMADAMLREREKL